MIYGRFLICRSLQTFNDQLELGEIVDQNIVFIEETNQIWTHGGFYGGSSDSIVRGEWVNNSTFNDQSGNSTTGDETKLYLDINTLKLYVYQNNEFVELSSDNLELGQVSGTAYPGDLGAALSASLSSHTSNKSNPHSVTKAQVGLGNVENKSSATIRSEITKSDVTTALGYTPPTQDTTYGVASTSADGLMSSSDKTKLNSIASNAEVNQNAFSNVVVGSTTIAADSKTDSITLEAGSNVTITPDATNDKITIAAKDTTYGEMSLTEANTATSTTAKVISAKTLHDKINGMLPTDASESSSGLMSAADKEKLNDIEAGANKYTHPSHTAVTGKPTGNATPGFGGTFTVSQITSDSLGHVTSATDRTITIPSSTATTSAAGLMSAADKTKLNGLSNYSLPDATTSTKGGVIVGDNISVSSGKISVTGENVTDALGYTPAGTDVATTEDAGLMSAADKVKLEGIATGANKYTHPSYTAKSSGFYKVTVDSQGHVSGTTAVSKSDITALGIPGSDTDTKVTSVGNHYTPSANDDSAISVDASSTTAASWGSTSLVTGVNLQRDAAGHVTGMTVDSIKMPSNPNSNTTYTFASGTNGFTVTPSNGSAQTVTVTPSISNNVTYTGTLVDEQVATFEGTSGQVKASGYTIASSVPSGAKFTDTDTKVTSVGNHYSPAEDSNAAISASNGTATNITGTSGKLNVITGLKRDAKGHIVGVTSANIYSTDNNTTYSAITADELNTGTATTSRSVTAAVLGPWVKSQIDSKIAAADAMIYKGTIGTDGTVTTLPTTHSTGWTYKVITAGTYAGKACEVGDMIICLTDGTAANDSHWTVVQNNIDGAVTGPSSATSGRIAIFDGTTGKVIKDSGYTIATSVPSGAKFTDTDTKVTSVGNHYTPSADNNSTLSADASSSTAATWGSTDLVTGVNIQRDAKGHVTGVTVDSIQMPANPNSNTTYTFAGGTGGFTVTPSGGSAQTVSIGKPSTAGTADKAAQLSTARAIDGVNFNGTAAITHYGECSTAAGTAAKTVALTGFTLVTGARIAVKFTVTNTAGSPTLNVNSTGAKSIMYRGSAISSGYLAANRVYEFVYDGTDYELIGDINTDSNTTYGADRGISLSSGKFGHSNSAITAGTVGTSSATSGSTLAVPYVTYDAYGHITGTGTHTHTISGFLTSETYKGTVTKVSTGAGLTGGDITGSGTIKAKLKSETASTLDSTAMGSTSSRQYAVGVDKSGYLSVNIPWSNTTYSAGNGLTLSGTTLAVGAGTGISVAADTVGLATSGVTAGTYGDDEATRTLTHSDVFDVPQITVDAYGRITSASTKTLTLPASGDTHYTTGINAGASGATSNSAQTNPYVTVKDNSTYRSQIRLLGGGATSVSSDASGNITISSTNTTYNIYSKSATTAATAGWYRIATSVAGIEKCEGTFEIQGTVSGKHSTATVIAGTNYGVADSSNISVLHCSQYTAAAISKVRIVYHTTYSGNYAYLEVYNPNATAVPITVKLVNGYGWSLVNPNTAGSVPSGYSSKEATLTNGTIYSEKFSGNGSGLSSLNASNISSGTINASRLPAASTSAQGAMTAAMVTKLNGITESADSVSFSRSLTSGTKIGTITINGSATDLYCQTNTDTDTHWTTGIAAGGSGATSNAATSNPYITIRDNSTHRGQVQIKGGGATTVSSDANGVITITSTDTNTQRAITDSVSTTNSSTAASATAVKTAYDKAVSAYNLANGKTSNTGTVTSVATGVGLTGGSITTSGTVKAKLRSETALTVDSAAATTTSGRVYPVAVDKTGYLAVNVPWTDSNTTYSAGTGLSLSSGAFSVSYGTSAGTACQGNDSRLSNSRPASDVYSWAKASSKPSYTKSEVGLSNVANIDQSKAIKSITRSGTTFTYTCLDGSTGTFTQQDNNTTYSVATSSANGLMSKDDKAKLDALGGITTLTKTITVGTSWVDTGITLNNVGSAGTYVVQIYMSNSSSNGAYDGYWSGIMSNCGKATNSTSSDEILLHCDSHANGAILYLRTLRQSGSSAYTKLQIASSVSIASTSYTFKFRKLI